MYVCVVVCVLWCVCVCVYVCVCVADLIYTRFNLHDHPPLSSDSGRDGEPVVMSDVSASGRIKVPTLYIPHEGVTVYRWGQCEALRGSREYIVGRSCCIVNYDDEDDDEDDEDDDDDDGRLEGR